jgi:endoglucanase
LRLFNHFRRRSIGGFIVSGVAMLSCVATAFFLLVRTVSADEAGPAFEAVKRLGRGINILGYDGIWDGGVDAPFKFGNFRRIRQAGFQHVRINFFAFKYMNAHGRVDPVVLAALDDVLAAAIAAGLIPVIDEHNGDECEREIANCQRLLVAFWTQIASRYRGMYLDAIFEVLNEPGGNMGHDDWNELALTVLKAIRTLDKSRLVIVAALNSEDPQELRALTLPETDPSIILTVHYYKPMSFTHQGAPWIPNGPPAGVPWGSNADRGAVTRDFLAIKRWADAQRRPVYLGEFGVYDKAEIASRVNYLSFVARSSEQNGWAWASWQFDHDFAVFDTERDEWKAQLLHALIPP